MGEIKRAARRNPSGFLVLSSVSSDRLSECSASMTGNADGVPTAAAMSGWICSGSSHCRWFVFNGCKVAFGAFMSFSPSKYTINRKAFLSVLGELRSASALHTACQSVFASIGIPVTEENREIYFFVLHRR